MNKTNKLEKILYRILEVFFGIFNVTHLEVFPDWLVNSVWIGFWLFICYAGLFHT